MMTEDDLYPYQAEGVAWLRQGGRKLLGDDPGLGKTPQALLAAQSPTLVVAANSLHGQWQAEAERWRPDLDLTVVTYQGIVQRKGRKIVKGAIKPEIAEVDWGTVIADEAVKLKGRKANSTRVFAKLAKRTDDVFLLSGTPLPNWAHEIFQLLSIMRPGDPQLSSYWRWVTRWFETYEIDYGTGRPVRQIGRLRDYWTWDEFVLENHLHEHYLGRRKADHLPGLPPVTIVPWPVRLKGEQARLYKSLKADYVAWVAESGEEVSAWSSGGLHTKLRKAATGVPVVAPDSKGPMAKVSTAIEMIEDAGPVVVFAQYRRTVEVVVEAAEAAGYKAAWIMGGMKPAEIDRHRRDFQDGKLDVLVGTFEMMSEGLTLTAASLAIMIEKSFRPDLNSQAIDRLHRIGQTKPVTVIDLYAEGTVDEGQRQLLEAKVEQTTAATEAIRRLSAAEFAKLI